MSPADHAGLDQQLRRYLSEGGFPEAQGATSRDRAALPGGYVDVVVIQACLESEGDQTWERELRALVAAAAVHPHARPFLVTLDAVPPTRPMPDGLTWASAAQWLLEEM